MKKRALSLLLAFVMTLGLAVPAFAAEAPDAPFDELEAQDIDLAAPTEPEAPVPVEEAEEPAPAEPMDVPAPAAEDVMPIDVPVAAAASTVTYNSGHGWADAVRKGADAELSAYVVEDSDKVTLQQDVDLAKYINPQSGDLTIDLAGHTLSMNAGTLVYVTGTNVTIMSSKPGGRVYSRLVDGKPTSDNGNALAVYGGSLKIGKNVTVEENGYKHPTFMIYGNGSLTIEQGAAVTADIANENPEKPVGVIQIGATESYPSKGTLTLNGEVNATNLNHAIVVAYDGSEVTIGEGAKIKTNDGDGVVAMNNNTITMTGGAIEVGADTMTSIGLQTAKGTISISGNSKISGGVYGVATGGKLTITGGEITNTMVGIGTNGSESGTAEINVTNATVSGTVAGVYLAAGQMTLGTGAKVSGQAGVPRRQADR